MLSGFEWSHMVNILFSLSDLNITSTIKRIKTKSMMLITVNMFIVDSAFLYIGIGLISVKYINGIIDTSRRKITNSAIKKDLIRPVLISLCTSGNTLLFCIEKHSIK